MINVVLSGLVLSALLAADPAAAPASPPPPFSRKSPTKPSFWSCVARGSPVRWVIAAARVRCSTDWSRSIRTTRRFLTAALTFRRESSASPDQTRALRLRLAETLAKPGTTVPFPLLREIARDDRATSEELARVVSLLSERPGEGSDRVWRLRLKVEVLDRLNRPSDVIQALEELAGLDPDPFVAFRLLGAYREQGRWDDRAPRRGSHRHRGAERRDPLVAH